LLNTIKKWFNNRGKSNELKYLEQSKDLVDLERRQLQIMRGEAPFQYDTKLIQQIERNLLISHRGLY